jgi:glycine cleavage system H protein
VYPTNYRYSKEHEWVKIDGNVATIGITDHAQKALGDIVFVELPKAGAKLEATQACGTVESVKAVSEIYSPVSGQVAEANAALADTPELINQDPHGKAWMLKVTLAGANASDQLMTAEQYETYLQEESGS